MGNKFLEKIATLIQLYRHSRTGALLWHQENKPEPGEEYEKVTGASTYIKKGQKRGKSIF